MKNIIVLLVITLCLFAIVHVAITKEKYTPSLIINKEYCLEKYGDYYVSHVPLKCIEFFDNKIVIGAE